MLFLRLWLLGIGVMAQSEFQNYGICQSCVCKSSDDGRINIDCKMKALTGIPDLQDMVGKEEIYKLELNYNRINSIPSGHFNGLQIEKIQLSNAGLTDIPNDAFDGIIGLRYLSLANNKKLEVPPSTYLEPVKDILEVLDLSQCEMYCGIDDNFFGRLPMLESLHLKDIGSSCFTGEDSMKEMPNLQTLDISGSIVQQLPETIKHLKNLEVISANRCGLEEIQGHLISQLDHIMSIHASNNKLTGLLSWEQRINSLQVLDLSMNNLANIPYMELKLTPNLKKLNLAFNRLAHLEYDQGVPAVEKLYFQPLVHLEELDLSNHDGDWIFPYEIISTLSPGLTVLNLQRLSIGLEQVSELLEGISHIEDLETLKMTLNAEEIKMDTFARLKADTLDLSYSKIKEIHPNAFISRTSDPVNLQISHTKIKNLDFMQDPCQFQQVFVRRIPDLECNCSMAHLKYYIKEGSLKLHGDCYMKTNDTLQRYPLKDYLTSTVDDMCPSSSEVYNICAVIGGTQIAEFNIFIIFISLCLGYSCPSL